MNVPSGSSSGGYPYDNGYRATSEPATEGTPFETDFAGSGGVITVDGDVTFTDGRYHVGDDIPPGTYRSSNPDSRCYWERYGAANVIAIGGRGAGPDIVTIAPGDAVFVSDGCGSWTNKVEPFVGARAGQFSDGTYLVGTDIQPGMYAADGASSCSWIRLSGFGGTQTDSIASGGGYQPTITIAPTDTGFQSSQCGTWTLVKAGLAPKASNATSSSPALTAATHKLVTFDDGDYRVGTDIPPGTYRAIAVQWCSWQRRAKPSGDRPGAVGAGGPGPVVVTVEAWDDTFWSSGCGTGRMTCRASPTA